MNSIAGQTHNTLDKVAILMGRKKHHDIAALW